MWANLVSGLSSPVRRCIGAALFFSLAPISNAFSETSRWNEIERGYHLTRYELPGETMVFRSEVFLARFDPQYFSFSLSRTRERRDIVSHVDGSAGIAGINASFFDERGEPLGLLVIDSRERQRRHLGGHLLTGIFSTDGERASITHRSDSLPTEIANAVQAGPRLIAGGRPLSVTSPFVASRRSGVALTSGGEIVLFATVLRFPGASFHQLQQMFLDPNLGVIVTDALNFDGGGSSQLYLKSTGKQASDILVTGGDPVPVGLIVKRRNSREIP